MQTQAGSTALVSVPCSAATQSPTSPVRAEMQSRFRCYRNPRSHGKPNGFAKVRPSPVQSSGQRPACLSLRGVRSGASQGWGGGKLTTLFPAIQPPPLRPPRRVGTRQVRARTLQLVGLGVHGPRPWRAKVWGWQEMGVVFFTPHTPKDRPPGTWGCKPLGPSPASVRGVACAWRDWQQGAGRSPLGQSPAMPGASQGTARKRGDPPGPQGGRVLALARAGSTPPLTPF